MGKFIVNCDLITMITPLRKSISDKKRHFCKPSFVRFRNPKSVTQNETSPNVSVPRLT